MGVPTVPADAYTLCSYVVYMARSFKYSSAQNYLSGVSYLHKWYGYEEPPVKCFEVTVTMKGVRRMLGDTIP